MKNHAANASKTGIVPITPKTVPIISAVENLLCPAAGVAVDVGLDVALRVLLLMWLLDVVLEVVPCVMVLGIAAVEVEGAFANFLYQ